jgi:TRAP-type C4-dicarboxylate transport system permease small subunit
MAHFARWIRRILDIGMGLGSVFLVGMMILIVANIIYRTFGHVIKGSYELSELFIVVTASFALGYAALHKSHVDVQIVVAKLPKRLQNILAIVTSFLSIGAWAAMTWAGTLILLDRWSTEETEMLLIPYFPFRLVLIVGLSLITLVYLIDAILAAQKAVSK